MKQTKLLKVATRHTVWQLICQSPMISLYALYVGYFGGQYSSISYTSAFRQQSYHLKNIFVFLFVSLSHTTRKSWIKEKTRSGLCAQALRVVPRYFNTTLIFRYIIVFQWVGIMACRIAPSPLLLIRRSINSRSVLSLINNCDFPMDRAVFAMLQRRINIQMQAKLYLHFSAA